MMEKTSYHWTCRQRRGSLQHHRVSSPNWSGIRIKLKSYFWRTTSSRSVLTGWRSSWIRGGAICWEQVTSQNLHQLNVPLSDSEAENVSKYTESALVSLSLFSLLSLSSPLSLSLSLYSHHSLSLSLSIYLSLSLSLSLSLLSSLSLSLSLSLTISLSLSSLFSLSLYYHHSLSLSLCRSACWEWVWWVTGKVCCNLFDFSIFFFALSIFTCSRGVVFCESSSVSGSSLVGSCRCVVQHGSCRWRLRPPQANTPTRHQTVSGCGLLGRRGQSGCRWGCWIW